MSGFMRREIFVAAALAAGLLLGVSGVGGEEGRTQAAPAAGTMPHDHGMHGSAPTAPEATPLAETVEPPALLEWMGRFHPMAVHFPIVLILLVVLSEGVRTIRPSSPWAAVGGVLAPWAALAAVGAAVLGLAGGRVSNYSPGLQGIFVRHRIFGIGVALGAVAVAGLIRRRDAFRGIGSWAYRLLLLLLVAAVFVTGHLGGSLVFGKTYLLWPPR